MSLSHSSRSQSGVIVLLHTRVSTAPGCLFWSNLSRSVKTLWTIVKKFVDPPRYLWTLEYISGDSLDI
jgi:hypothetical protein